MAKNTFCLIFIKITSLPFRLLSKIFEFYKIDNLDIDIDKSLKIIDKYSFKMLDKNLIDVLIIAEDKRNSIHNGIDTIAILRAIKVRLLNDIYQGQVQ